MKYRPTLSGHRLLRLAAILLLLPAAGCMQFVTQQGNVLKPAQINQIQVGDSRFNVESLIGTPVLKDDLHPNRVIYMEEYDNPKTDKHFDRRVEIVYDEAGNVKSIRRFGFGKNANESEDDQPDDAN